MAPERVIALPNDHPAITENRPMFPSTVVAVDDSPRLLVSGENSRKLGHTIVKGPWRGFRIYQLTLAERTTCPRSCHQFNTCYGNAMHRARRHAPGPALERRLMREVRRKAQEHPEGFAVRLHGLGDFYSIEYVEVWERLLTRHPALHCFGYTAFLPDASDPEENEIGCAIARVKLKFGARFYIRWSSANPRIHGSTVIDRKPEGPRVPEGIVCPAETEKTQACATCGLCWSPDLWDETIVFVLHGLGVNHRPRSKKPGKPRPVKPRRPRTKSTDGSGLKSISHELQSRPWSKSDGRGAMTVTRPRITFLDGPEEE